MSHFLLVPERERENKELGACGVAMVAGTAGAAPREGALNIARTRVVLLHNIARCTLVVM